MRYVRSLLHHVGPFVVVYRLNGCSMWASVLHSMWDLSSLIRDQTHVSCITRQIHNHWTNKCPFYSAIQQNTLKLSGLNISLSRRRGLAVKADGCTGWTRLWQLCLMQGTRSGSDLPVPHSPGACRMAGTCSSHADNRGTTEQVQLQKNISSFGLGSIC